MFVKKKYISEFETEKLRKRARIIFIYYMYYSTYTSRELRLSSVNFSGKCEQICNFLCFSSFLLKETRRGRFYIFYSVIYCSRRYFNLSDKLKQLNNDQSSCCFRVLIFGSVVSHVNFTCHILKVSYEKSVKSSLCSLQQE